MSYSTILNDIVDVDKLTEQIRVYVKKFQECEEFFIHCKNEENFERNLERQVPELRYKLERIYISGRDLASSVPSHICECLAIERNSLLKTAIDKLEYQLEYLEEWGRNEYSEVEKVYRESRYYEWSINHMLSKTIEMVNQIAEILIIIRIIKSSYSYQLQAGEITTAEIREIMRVKMNTINNTGNFQNSQISNGDNNTNSMTVSPSNNEELALICQKLIEVISQSEAKPEEKEAVKAIVQDMAEANNSSTIKNKYRKLISAISDHITIGTAILNSSVLLALTNFVID